MNTKSPARKRSSRPAAAPMRAEIRAFNAPAPVSEPAQRPKPKNRRQRSQTVRPNVEPAAGRSRQSGSPSQRKVVSRSAQTRTSREAAQNPPPPVPPTRTNCIPAGFRKPRLGPAALEALTALRRAKEDESSRSAMSVQEVAALTGLDQLEANSVLKELVTQGFMTERRRFFLWCRYELAV